MPLPPFVQLANTFGQWVNITNNLISHVDNTSVYILVSQNATPRVSTGNVSINGVMTITGSVSDQYGDVRTLPILGKTATYELTTNDVGRTVSTNANVTVNGAILSANQIFTVFNNSTSAITIVSGTGATIYLAGTSSTGNRTLAEHGLATIYCVTANTFVISGAGMI